MLPPSPSPSIWRSLAEQADEEAFETERTQEFPGLNDLLSEPQPRRKVLKIMAAAFALGGLGGCDDEPSANELVPPVITPPDIVPGLPSTYSSAFVIGGYASGILVRHRDGRPIKVEGNPVHPASLGATDIFAQAELLGFYDPERAHGPAYRNRPAGWPSFLAALRHQRDRFGASRGAGFRILSGSLTSPTQIAQIGRLRTLYPNLQWHQWDAVSRDNVQAGGRLAYGREIEVLPHLAEADRILAIDSDLLSAAPGHLRFAHDFAGRRNPTRTAAMCRLYAVESTPSLTGSVADHRFVAGPGDIAAVLGGLAAAILRNEGLPEASPPWLAPVVADLKAHSHRALVHIGPDQAPQAHALVHAINEALGAPGHTLTLIAPVATLPSDPPSSLAELVRSMRAGTVETLLILGGNPVFAAPADLGFAEALQRVDCSICLAPEVTETTTAATWHIPETHGFEAWSDARAYDGTASIIQPQAMPLYDGRSAQEMLALFAGDVWSGGQALLRRTWQERLADDDAWQDALAKGIVAGTASPPLDTALRSDAVTTLPRPADAPLTVLFRPDPQLWDGRFANNAWLQEMPRPLTKLAWDNPLLIAPALAGRLGLGNGDMVTLTVMDRKIEAPVWILPGHATDCVTASFGFGRWQAGLVGQGVGFDYFPLRRSDGLSAAAATIAKTGRTYRLATTEHHSLLMGGGEEIVRQRSLAAFLADPRPAAEGDPAVSLYDKPPHADVAWGMSIDLNACIGCNACVIACQAENNIPVVGKSEMLREREMHWLRIDRYYSGSPDAPQVRWQPLPCQHCEEAPCEVVCPVGATLHDSEGLNVMVYNRCIGTRFCSNNCPYKVRRFNYRAYSGAESRPDQSRNPEVTVRARGVMEKCTFCLQRIAAARIDADMDDRPIRDGEVVTACQAACPTQAFSFGDVNDRNSAVAVRKASPLRYSLLGELNTRPRVTYENRIRNPLPDLEGEPS